MNNQYGTIIWLKTHSLLYNLSSYLYLGCVYIPPNNSSFYRFYDCDLLDKLENQITTYPDIGKVMLLWDFIARTSIRDDFMANDIISNNILSDVSEFLTYEMDEILPLRVNLDKIVNVFGSKLLPACKSSGLRILN